MNDADFTGLCRELMPGMYRMSLSMLQHHADAQDAVQQALMKAWARRHTVRTGAEKAWLMRIVINECHNIHRQQNQVQPLWRYDKLSEAELVDYERSEIRLSFTVTVPEVQWEQLATDKETYEIAPGVSFRVAEAYRTPLNIYATIDVAVVGMGNQLDAMEKWDKLFFDFERADGHVSQIRALTSDVGWRNYYELNSVYHTEFPICTGAYDEAEFAEDDGLYLVCRMGKEMDREGYISLVKMGKFKLHVVK